jgi:LuxR family maltose regulon positive regulatory protein
MQWLDDLGSNVESPDRKVIWKRIRAEQAGLLLSLGQGVQAYERLEQGGMTHSDEVARSYFDEYLMMVRILAANGRIEDARQLLEQLERLADKENRLRGRIKLKIAQSVVLWQSGNPQEALVSLEFALSLAEPAGYIRSFLDEGTPMAEMLGELAMEREEVGKRLAPLPYVHMLLKAAGRGGTSASLSSEPLTEQEEKVLRLLTEGLIYKEIAVRLHITLDTVKFHMKNIYRKLGVGNRTQAIERVNRHRLMAKVPAPRAPVNP